MQVIGSYPSLSDSSLPIPGNFSGNSSIPPPENPSSDAQCPTLSHPSTFPISLRANALQHSLNPEKRPLNVIHPPVDELVEEQLNGLISICTQLSASNSSSLQTLLELSWGIASLPKEKKFSKEWCAIISERYWLILEDISRQIAKNFPRDSYSQEDIEKIQSLLSDCALFAPGLQNVFKALKSPPTPKCELLLLSSFSEIDSLFSSDFHNFILEHTEKNLQVINSSLQNQDPGKWLTNKTNVKALFRLLEIIGEASKLVGEKDKQQLPILALSDERPLWGKLRNHLHHNKRRTWEVVELAPEKWIPLLNTLLPELEQEVKQFLQHSPLSTLKRADAQENFLAILTSLNWICGQEADSQISHSMIRHKWDAIKQDFVEEPLQLKQILWGLETPQEKNFSQIWENYAQPYLKLGIDLCKNKISIFELLRFGNKNFLDSSSIEKLTWSDEILDKEAAIYRMKELLRALSYSKSKEVMREFDFLANQFVFLKQKKSGGTTKWERDTEKNDALKQIMSQSLRKLSPPPLSSATFENEDQSLTEYGCLLRWYVKLKCHRIAEEIRNGHKILQEIRASWPQEEIDLLSFKNQKKMNKKDNPHLKRDFTQSYEQLLKEYFYIGCNLKTDKGIALAISKERGAADDRSQPTESMTEKVTKAENSIKKLKVFSPNKIANSLKDEIVQSLEEMVKLEEKVKEIQEKSLQACEELEEMLSEIACDESSVYELVKTDLLIAIKIVDPPASSQGDEAPPVQENIQTIKKIFDRFLFTDTSTMLEEIKKAKLERSPLPEADSASADQFYSIISPSPQSPSKCNLNKLRQQVVAFIEGKFETDVEKKIDQLVQEAEEELSTSFVQTVLHFNEMPPSHAQAKEILPQRDSVLLRNIYKAGLPEDKRTLKQLAWEDVERKLDNKLLLASHIQEVISWFPEDDISEEKKELLDYLNGTKKFELSQFSRFEHAAKKIEIFQDFLEKCFNSFPQLRDNKEALVNYFKIAYKIIGTEDKAIYFAEKFEKTIKDLGKIFSEILEKEQQGICLQEMNVLLLAAEYDLQDVGELATLITERPSVWNMGRHLLSSHHLLSIGLMRKMMAHYPLVLAPETLRWNIEYLAFDARNLLSQQATIPHLVEAKKSLKRTKLLAKDLKSQIFDIKNLLDRLNLDLVMDVLHPSLNTSYQAFLHPFGELALLVHPPFPSTSQREFTHAVMELELILNDKFDAKIHVIGNWENTLINISSKQHIPLHYLERMLEEKIEIHDWIAAQECYDIFKSYSWSRITTTSGGIVNRSEHELHHHLLFFFKTLNLSVNPLNLQQFLQSKDLENEILKKIQSLRKQAISDYPTSQFFRWVCSLFEHFCPPGVTPLSLVSFPKKEGEEKAFVTMVDDNLTGLLFLPEEKSDEELSTSTSATCPYYKEQYRLDIFNERSVLKPAVPIKEEELPKLAEYAAAVLRAHASFILKLLDPLYGLEASQFRHVKKIESEYLPFIEEIVPINEIKEEIHDLIKDEAENLLDSIINMTSNFCKQEGENMCIYMLKWIEIDKKIETVATNYYKENHLRMKAPYCRMDPLSRQIFDEKHIKNNELKYFSFVNCFQSFLGRIVEQTEFLTANFDFGKNPVVTGDFNSLFKTLVPEKAIQRQLLKHMKEREIIMCHVAFHFSQKNPLYSLLEGPIESLINEYYLKWDKLFRMISQPEFFQTLQTFIRKKGNACNNSLLIALERDFEAQYKTGRRAEELATAFTPHGKVYLLGARAQFDRKYDVNTRTQARKNFVEAIETSPYKFEFSTGLNTLYSESPYEFFDYSLINQAREALDSLLFSSTLPDRSLIPPPTYRDYWKFVLRKPVEMVSTSFGRGHGINFKKYLQNNGTFEELLENEEKKRLLLNNPAISALIKAYIVFFPLENALSNWFYYLKEKTELNEKLKNESLAVEREQKNEWITLQYKSKIKDSEQYLEYARSKYQEVRDEIKKTQFFKMLKFHVKWQPLLEGKKPLSEDEQVEEVFQHHISA